MAQSPKPKDATAAATAEPTSEDLSLQLELLKADIARLTETVADYGKAKGRRYAADARRTAADLRGQAEDQAMALRGQAEDKMDDVERYVRENPTTALGIAAGIGLLIGLFSRR